VLLVVVGWRNVLAAAAAAAACLCLARMADAVVCELQWHAVAVAMQRQPAAAYAIAAVLGPQHLHVSDQVKHCVEPTLQALTRRALMHSHCKMVTASYYLVAGPLPVLMYASSHKGRCAHSGQPEQAARQVCQDAAS